jgi:hypothetical protein
MRIIIFVLQEILFDLKQSAPNVDAESLVKLVSFSTALSSGDSTTTSFPEFPIDSLKNAVKIMENNPNLPVADIICRLYPYKLFLPRENWETLQSLFASFDIALSEKAMEQQVVAVDHSANDLQSKGK